MKWFIVRSLTRMCVVQDVNSAEAQKRFLMRHPECRERVWVQEIKSVPGGQILEIAKEETGEEKLWLIRGPNHPDCFFKASSQRKARELFLHGVESHAAFGGTTYTELSLAAFLEICPEGFLINADVDF